MSSRFRNALLLVMCIAASSMAKAQQPLRVCADPDDLPFSGEQQAGFDNRIAQVLGQDVHRPIVFVWSRARRGFLREQFNKGVCDMLMGVPQGMKRVRSTVPYYRSSYVFVTRRSDGMRLARFDDPRIGKQRIGLQILEEDFSPPSLPLIRTGHASQLVGFESFGGGGAQIVRAVAHKDVGLAVVWGPIAGYYTAKLSAPLAISPVRPAMDSSGIPLSYAMTIGVHSKDEALATQLNGAIERNRKRILTILSSYHVPVDEDPGGEK